MPKKTPDFVDQSGFWQKRFYTRGTIRGIRISRLAKIPPLYQDWLRSLNREEGQLFELHRGGFERHSPYCAKCCDICFSIKRSILF